MHKRLILLTVLGVALCGGAYVRAQFGNEPAKLSVVKLKDDLFVIHNEYVPGNTTVMVTNEGLVLVDDKFEIDHANILAALKTFTNQPVKYVVNTHHHGDHSGDNAKLQEMGAMVVTSWQARQHMVDGKQPGLSNFTFDGKASLHLGGKRVDLFHFGRAHTSGDIVALFPVQRVLAAGDMFTVGNATPQLVDYPGGGSAKDWPQTLDGVLGLDFDQVVPGHGTVATKADLQKFRESAMRLRTRVHDMIVAKSSRADIEKMLRSEFFFADFHIDASLDGLLVELR
jgi:glyoxylase-like metal-dependent hydrolase (beta-lactamase superfamily II)